MPSRFVSITRYALALALVNAPLAAAPAGAAEASARPVRILALGDSLVAGYGLRPEDAFPARLAAALAESGVVAEVINAGVSGDTSAGGVSRLDWTLKERPDLVLVELGANDGLRGLDPATTFANLDVILRRLRRAGIKVLLAGMQAPPNLGREYGYQFAHVYPALAQRHGVALYPFFLDGVATDPALNQADGIHPNPAGVQVIAARIAPHIVKVIRAGP
jgi:acyl-CoA thioesterase-1